MSQSWVGSRRRVQAQCSYGCLSVGNLCGKRCEENDSGTTTSGWEWVGVGWVGERHDLWPIEWRWTIAMLEPRDTATHQKDLGRECDRERSLGVTLQFHTTIATPPSHSRYNTNVLTRQVAVGVGGVKWMQCSAVQCDAMRCSTRRLGSREGGYELLSVLLCCNR